MVTWAMSSFLPPVLPFPPSLMTSKVLLLVLPINYLTLRNLLTVITIIIECMAERLLEFTPALRRRKKGKERQHHQGNHVAPACSMHHAPCTPITPIIPITPITPITFWHLNLSIGQLVNWSIACLIIK